MAKEAAHSASFRRLNQFICSPLREDRWNSRPETKNRVDAGEDDEDEDEDGKERGWQKSRTSIQRA